MKLGRPCCFTAACMQTAGSESLVAACPCLPLATQAATLPAVADARKLSVQSHNPPFCCLLSVSSAPAPLKPVMMNEGGIDDERR
jgi:hypothetical protein